MQVITVKVILSQPQVMNFIFDCFLLLHLYHTYLSWFGTIGINLRAPTWRFQPEGNSRGDFTRLPLASIRFGNDFCSLFHFQQSLTQDGVESEEQVPVVVGEEHVVDVVLGMASNIMLCLVEYRLGFYTSRKQYTEYFSLLISMTLKRLNYGLKH